MEMTQLTFEGTEATCPIRAHLDTVFEAFLNLLPPGTRGQVREQCYFAGGCVVSLAQNADPVDYDLFIQDDATRDTLGALLSGLGSVHVKARTENAITLGIPGGAGERVVQVVTRFTGPPSRVFSTFDYEHCKAYYVPQSGELHGNWDLIRDKRLVYTGEKDKFTLNTLKRLVKFVRRGYLPDNASLVNLHKAIHKQDLDDPVIRAEQTIGFYGSSFE